MTRSSSAHFVDTLTGELCCTFVCGRCGRTTPASEGAAGDDLCDACWCAAETEREEHLRDVADDWARDLALERLGEDDPGHREG